jgi:hypothetical protein
MDLSGNLDANHDLNPPSKTAQFSIPTNFNIHQNLAHIELFSSS